MCKPARLSFPRLPSSWARQKCWQTQQEARHGKPEVWNGSRGFPIVVLLLSCWYYWALLIMSIAVPTTEKRYYLESFSILLLLEKSRYSARYTGSCESRGLLQISGKIIHPGLEREKTGGPIFCTVTSSSLPQRTRLVFLFNQGEIAVLKMSSSKGSFSASSPAG